MKKNHLVGVYAGLFTVFVVFAAWGLSASPVFADHHGGKHENKAGLDEFKAEEVLFNGKDLKGWSGDAKYWSVKDGVIHGTTHEQKANGNTFLVYQGEDVGDFHLSFEARCFDNNSGMMFRSSLVKGNPFAMAGYQCDIHPKAPYTAMIYGERMGKRGIIITRGQKMVIGEDGKKKILSEEKPEGVDISEWNTYEIICKGNHIVQKLNGKVAIDLVDNDKGKLLKGKIGIQLHAGVPMKVDFRNIKLLRYKN